MKKYKLNSNFILSDIVAQLNLGLLRKVRFIKIVKTPLAIRIFRILYAQGVIRTFKIDNDFILVYFKYINGQSICKLSIVTRPGKRCY